MHGMDSSNRYWHGLHGCIRVSVTIEPLGGLGNQLFVYALGRCLSMKLGVPLHVDLCNFRSYEWHDYELDSFMNSIDEQVGVKSQLTSRTMRKMGRLASSKLVKSKTWPSGRTFTEKSWRFDPTFLTLGDGARVRGYFQSWKYFENCSDLLRREIADIREPSAWFLKMQEELDSLPEWTAVHVRRGNYVTLPNMGLVDDDYYARAINLVNQLGGSMTVVVFSDDPEAARRMRAFSERPKTRFIESPPESRPIESMVLMSMGSHAVMANSTFSWWASWLAQKMDRIVICPRPWLDGEDFDDRDLIYPSWISIGRRSFDFKVGQFQ